MFTPQKKLWSLMATSEPVQRNDPVPGSSSSPRNGEIVARGKGVTLFESTHPSPRDILGVNGGTIDQETMGYKVLKLENELFEYQYNMGLLLIEKKEWTSRYEEVGKALAEAKDALQHEQAAHLIAISDLEKREENLRNKLGIEKQCVFDLEKALRDMRSEYAEIKFTADSKLSEATALVTSIEERSLEVEGKLHAADARFSEISRKSSEVERKLNELEAQEKALRRDRSSFKAEQETYETALSRRREDLREWERKLQEEEERLSESRRLLNLREQRANENDKILKMKESEFEDFQKKADLANSTLKKKEEEISSRLANLTSKEKEADILKKNLELKEKALLELEEKLNIRERVEIEKLLDEHKAILDAKKEKLELEMEEKQKLLNEDMKRKVIEVEKKEVEFSHKEEKIALQEQLLEKKLEKLKEKEKDLESVSKAVKEREKHVQLEEKKLENERKQLLTDSENFLGLKVELEKTRADIEKELLQIKEERDSLKVTEEERSEHTHLQSELKQEIENCRVHHELLLKEAEDLKLERERFEKEWEELDERKAEVDKELEDFTRQKEKLEKLRHSEEERLRNEKLETQNFIHRELEALKVAKDSFEAEMEHEKSLLVEKTQNEESRLLCDFELQKSQLETEMQRRKEEMEHHLRERETVFEEEKEREFNNIKRLREVAQKEIEEMKSERLRIQKEKEEISSHQRHLEGQQLEMRKDIDDLVGLSRKLKDQREQFVKEREHFIASIEKQKACKHCGEINHELVLPDLQPLAAMDYVGDFPLPSLADNYAKEIVQVPSERPDSEISLGLLNSGSPSAGGTMSWLRKCTTMIFKFSPVKKLELGSLQNMSEVVPPVGNQTSVELHNKLLSSDDEPELSLGVADVSFDGQRTQSDHRNREVEASQDPSVDAQSNINSEAQDIVQVSQDSDLPVGQSKPGRRGRPRVNITRSTKAVSTDAKGILGDTSKLNESGHVTANADDSTTRNGRKRHRVSASQTTASDLGGDDSEEHSGSVTTVGRRRRRKVDPALQALHENRYNFRHPKLAVATNGALSDLSKGHRKQVNGAENLGVENCNSEAASLREVDNGGGTRENLGMSAAPAPSAVIAGKDIGELRSTTVVASEDTGQLRSTAVLHHLSSHGPMLDSAADSGNVDITEKLLEDVFPSECLDVTPVRTRENVNREHRSKTHGHVVDDDEGEDSSNDDDDAEEEEAEHPGEASIGKKLWTFLTT